MTRVRLLLADDHWLVRSGIRSLLDGMPEFEVVGEAADGVALMALALQLKPDLVLTDITMPGLNGIEVTEQLSQQLPLTKVVILSMHHDRQYVRQILRLGAAGYVVKDAAPAELALALKTVLAGGTYLSPVLSQNVVDDYVKLLRSERQLDIGLTPRQIDVLKLVARGMSTKEVARQLNLSDKTVNVHRGQLMKQLGIHEVTGLVRYAVRTGLISQEQ
jgi:DNA-binding NarL/FixJ family response regulator